MAISENELKGLILNEFPGAEVDIVDLAGDGDHYQVTILSELFNNKTRVEQHRLVNQSLKGRLGNSLHALSIKTKSK